jgi:hypothetical protein
LGDTKFRFDAALKSNYAAIQPFKNSLGQKAFEWRKYALPELSDRIAHFRAAMVQNALDEARDGLGSGCCGCISVPLVHEFIEGRTVNAISRWRSQATVDRDLAAEIPRLDQNHVNTERARL